MKVFHTLCLDKCSPDVTSLVLRSSYALISLTIAGIENTLLTDILNTVSMFKRLSHFHVHNIHGIVLSKTLAVLCQYEFVNNLSGLGLGCSDKLECECLIDFVRKYPRLKYFTFYNENVLDAENHDYSVDKAMCLGLARHCYNLEEVNFQYVSYRNSVPVYAIISDALESLGRDERRKLMWKHVNRLDQRGKLIAAVVTSIQHTAYRAHIK